MLLPRTLAIRAELSCRVGVVAWAALLRITPLIPGRSVPALRALHLRRAPVSRGPGITLDLEHRPGVEAGRVVRCRCRAGSPPVGRLMVRARGHLDRLASACTTPRPVALAAAAAGPLGASGLIRPSRLRLILSSVSSASGPAASVVSTRRAVTRRAALSRTVPLRLTRRRLARAPLHLGRVVAAAVRGVALPGRAVHLVGGLRRCEQRREHITR